MFIFRQYLRLQFIIVMMIEALAFGAAPFLAAHLLARTFGDVPLMLSAWWPTALLFTAVMIAGLLSMGLYCARQRARFDGIVIRICIASVGAFVVLCLVFSLDASHSTSRYLLALTTLLAFVASVITRAVMEKIGNDDRFKRRVLVYGSGPRAMTILQLRRRTDQRGFVIVGFVPPVDGPPLESMSADLSDRLLPADESLLRLCRRLNADEIVLAMDDRRRDFPVQDLLECRMSGYEVIELLTFFERETGKVRVDVLNPSWMIFGDGFNRSSLRRLTERGFDFLASVLLATVTWPILVLIALTIKIEDGWSAPIFYLQTRVGFENRLFNVIKFRSMRVDAERDGTPRWAAPSDARSTRVGAVLRRVRPALAGEQLAYADLEMDVAAHRVRRGGQPVSLGPTEFRLLKHFLEHPGRVFSRERLLDAVWTHDPDIDSRTVDVHVRRLRQALNAGGRPDLIRTVRSAGYSLDSES